jgi:ATP phosphoribosyltransferase
MSAEPFVLAVPSKGRLRDNAFAFFARAGLALTQGRGARDYRGTLEGVAGVEVAFVSASEIVGLLASGQAHMGITGEDLIRETLEQADTKVALLTALGFGGANVVVAVPRAWIDVKTMADLEDVAAAFYARRGQRMRVATKYINLTRRFFADSHVTDYRIVESLGATEGAPGAGQAELIVDITTTGATLAANALKVLDDGVILRSEANLVASLSAKWDDPARERARQILARIAAEEEARLTRDVVSQFATKREGLIEAAATRFGATRRSENVAGRLTLTCRKDKVAPLADWLIAEGAEHVTVVANDYVFSPENALYRTLIERLPGAKDASRA